jgi:hypothetical protein
MIVGDKLYDTVDAEGKTKNGKRFTALKRKGRCNLRLKMTQQLDVSPHPLLGDILGAVIRIDLPFP